MDTLDFARDIWREFELNKSQGAGMTLTVDGVVTKQHGKATDTDDLNEMGNSIVHYRKPVEELKQVIIKLSRGKL
jgi:hypothetical protein